MHKDALQPGSRVLIHDDVLATGGTAEAAAKLVQQAGAEIAMFQFIVELSFLKGMERMLPFTSRVTTFARF
jgi:adenine phosphoribosyltransferase